MIKPLKIIIWFWLLTINTNWFFNSSTELPTWKWIAILVCMFILAIYMSYEEK